MIIGLTGGIGSGKSTVARIFEMAGCLLFKSDEEAREVYFRPAIREKIIRLLGKEAYTEKGLNKEYIGKIIFSDKSKLHELNSIIHPEVNRKFKELVSENPGRLIVIESALLFEAGIHEQADRIITVVAPDELRIKRVMERDQLSETEVRNKMKNQLSQEEKARRSHHVIENDERNSVILQATELVKTLGQQQ